MNMYTLESLKEINNRFCRSHEMTEYDVEKANEYVELIENSRSKLESKIGDMIQYTNEYGEYFEKAHIDEIYEDGELYICERPYVPFVGVNENNNGISCSTSGGAWEYLSKEKLTYVGKSKKRFCVWGNCGACADGAVEFEADVNVWSYTSSENKFISKITGNLYTTKEFNRMIIHYYANEYGQPKDGSEYIYFGRLNNGVWKSDKELQAWLRTFRAEVFEWGKNGMFVWYWKNEDHHVTPTEFENLKLPEDTILKNARILRCKRKYDEDTHTVHTYYVWYWDEPDKDFYKATEEQNKIREKFYTLDWHTPKNQFALKEFELGKVQPINLDFIKG